ncbi:Myb-like DNA-binding domain containing protein [Histomonas meleagridis]|uniref:Myb-like DNA-binding domain containing protein n=1 Tax=Histomonas meleagridis TaxID=135588 RepID=UPI00355A698A|nr:Myb-like DNA-binding domain containing protein [Histomonas meleagridis]KAH0802977.1 Myb-like DNA-binding domain containing protein [Histomonas meleagridis]
MMERRRERSIQSHKKVKWTQVEDDQLREAVKIYGKSNWSSVAQHVQGRNGKQCRERWIGMLDPNLVRDGWTPVEDALLLEKQKEYGNKWSKIVSFFPNRSSITIKNRWNWLIKHVTPEQLSPPHTTEVVDLKEHQEEIFFVGSSWRELDFLDYSHCDCPLTNDWFSV